MKPTFQDYLVDVTNNRSNLIELDLREFKLNADDIKALAKALVAKPNTNIKVLNLSGCCLDSNGLRSEGTSALVDLIHAINRSRVNTLDLSNNGLEGPSTANKLATALENGGDVTNTTLTYINLVGNPIQSEIPAITRIDALIAYNNRTDAESQAAR